jgi:hypothetical protein
MDQDTAEKAKEAIDFLSSVASTSFARMPSSSRGISGNTQSSARGNSLGAYVNTQSSAHGNSLGAYVN